MLDKKTRKLIFLEAGMVIIIVFILTIVLTDYLDNWRIDDLDDQLSSHSVHHNSFLAANTFFEAIGVEDCDFSRKMILDEYEVIKELGEDVSRYKQRMLKTNEVKHDLKKREYLIVQVESLNKVYKYNRVCEQNIHPLLYFVDGDIVGFDAQSLLLQQFQVSNEEDVLLYNIDINYEDELVVDSLLRKYSVERHGTVVFGNISNHEGGTINILQLMNELENLRET